VLGGHYFKGIRDRRSVHKAAVQPDQESLTAILSLCVVEPFTRITESKVLAIALPLTAATDVEDPAPNPGHPACAEYAGSDYCRESWQLHLAELACRRRTHWHKCDYGRLCAIVPIVHRDRCLAAVKLACPASMAEEDFERHVEFLDILVEGFVISHADLLERLPLPEQALAESDATPPHRTGETLDRQSHHPKVLKALEYIDAHLSDPKLTVGRIARELDVDSSYLGRLFADEVGQRMNWFIAARRVDLAKTLLTTTDWLIKQIAFETGHANPVWFCYVFQVHTGLSPSEYRKLSGHSSPPTSPR